MILAALALYFAQSGFVAKLDELAQRRDVAGLTAVVATGAWKGRNPLDAIRTNGAYDTGRFGWRALSGADPAGKQYVLFTTPLTSEDIGERLFESNGESLTRYIDEREDNGWWIERHSLTVRFDIQNKKVKISDLFKLRHKGADGPLMLRLSPNYRVQGVKDEVGTEVKWTQIGGVVFIGEPEDGKSLNLTYEGVVDKPGYAGSITPTEAMLTNDYWYPMIARKPSPFSIRIYGPQNWTAVCHGELKSSEVVGTERLTIYDMPLPISYWSLNIAPYKSIEQTIGSRKYKVWSKTLTDVQMQLQPRFYPLILDTYETFGKFPFSGYGACVTPLYGGGALEGYSFETAGYYPGEDAHETAHTWFGGMVNNTYLRSMWNESFADWASGWYRRNAALGNKAERNLAYVSTPMIDDVAYFAAPLADSPPDIGPAASTLGYGKGAFVLQMLEQELGPDRMVAACKDWIATQDRTRGGEWEDFEAAVKRHSEQDLTWFFDEWVRKPGFAQFKISDVKFVNGAVTGRTTFKGEPYRLTCEVLLATGNSRTLTKVEFKGDGRFRIPTAQKPTWVSFDPYNRIVRKIDPSEFPPSLSRNLDRMKRVDALNASDMLKPFGKAGGDIPSGSLNGYFLVGSPELDVRLKPLFTKAGFSVAGNRLTYKGTTIDLQRGGAIALVDLEGGGRCAIGIGNIEYRPDFGHARTVVFDELGRFIRGETSPKSTGPFVFKL